MSTSTWQHEYKITLIALPDAPYWARRHTEDMLVKWRAKPLVPDAQLVVTELISNALKATITADEATQQLYAAKPTDIPFRELVKLCRIPLRLSYGNGWLLMEVGDESTDPPEQQLPDFVSEHGRGLFIVNAYSEKWGWYPTYAADLNGERQQTGKVVWAELVHP